MLSISLSVPLPAQQINWAADSDPRVQFVVESERKWAESNCAARPELRDIIADDFLGTSPSGSRFGKQRAIETDMAALEHDCRLDAVKVRFLGETLALAYGSERSKRKEKNGKEAWRCLVWTDTWVKRNEKWQIVAAQDTAVPCARAENGKM